MGRPGTDVSYTSSSFSELRSSVNPKSVRGYSRTATSRSQASGLRTRDRPKTTASGATGGHDVVICAATEARGVSTTVGLCFINVTSGECILCEICDTRTYVRTMHKLQAFDPVKILIPSSLTGTNSILSRVMAENLPGCEILPIGRKYYSEQVGQEYLQQLAFLEDVEVLRVATNGKFYALSAASAAFKYVEVSLGLSFSVHSLPIKYQASEWSMVIDFNTVKLLELVQNFEDSKSPNSLFGVLNNTLSPMGARILRASILQPSTDISALNKRLDAVAELINSEATFFNIQKALKSSLDFDRLLTSLITIPTTASLKQSEDSINNLIMLKEAIRVIFGIVEALSGVHSQLLVAVRDLCDKESVIQVQELLDAAINEDVQWAKSPLELRQQRCYAVKSGFNGLLDVARKSFKEATEDVYTLVQHLQTTHSLKLELKYDTSRGYYLTLPLQDLEECRLPECFINTMQKKRQLEFTCMDLLKRNAKINDSLTEVLLMSDKTVQQVIIDTRASISTLYKISEAIAILDMITSFVHLCTIHDYVRPEFTGTLAFRAGKHPIRQIIQKDRMVPNDAYASQQSRFQIITGCNMSGKSTYIRQICLMAVMAQIGCFVPAVYASFPITRQLFCRASTDDGSDLTVSTFSSEMRDMAFILRNVQKGTLCIVDELGRGTSTLDGLAIAIAVSENLLASGAFVWFATHFRELPVLMREKAGVINLHMQVEVSPGTPMTMLYKVKDGGCDQERYGIALARMLLLPQKLLEKAEIVSSQIAQRMELKKNSSKVYTTARRRKLVLGLKESLMQARQSLLEEEQLRTFLTNLQHRFVEEMANLLPGDGVDTDSSTMA